MKVRLPRFIAHFLMRRGIQDAVPCGEEFISTGAEIIETFRTKEIITLEITDLSVFLRFLIKGKK